MNADPTTGENEAFSPPTGLPFGIINGLPIDDRILDLEENDDSWDLGVSGEPIFQEMALPVDSNRNAIKEQQVNLWEEKKENDSSAIEFNISQDNEVMVNQQDWGEWDVPLGKSNKLKDLVGKRRYQDLVDQYRSSYVNATTHADRINISRTIFAAIHDHGGRFLDRKNISQGRNNNVIGMSHSTEEWYELAKEQALAKISQALRIGTSTDGDGSGENKTSSSLDSDEEQGGILPCRVPLGRPMEVMIDSQQDQQQQPTDGNAESRNNNEPLSPASASPSTVSKAKFSDPVSIVKSVFSMALLVFCIVLVMALIFEKQTPLSEDTHPALAFIVMWVALLWLALVEGGQASMVGLPPIERDLYKETHPISFRICEYGHRGDNLDRYLIGRQFMVLVLVFIINLAGTPIEDANVLGLPDTLSNFFLGSGLAMILMTCMIGQLNTQVNASHCMLDFLNNWANWFTVKVALTIEASGLLHAAYLIQIVLFKLAGKELISNEEPRNTTQNIIFWGRVCMSFIILIFALVATIAALFEGKTTVWEVIPEPVALILFIFLMCVVGMLEGMQIAFFAVAKLTDEERRSSVWATRTCDLLFRGAGHNLPGFMVGRQLFVVACFFVIARVTSMNIEEGESNVLGVSDGVERFFDTGLLGALVTTIVASITWQLLASAFPLAFLSTPITYILLRICLFLENTGICHCVWVLAAFHKQLSGFQRDEVYVGTAEERAAMYNSSGDEGDEEEAKKKKMRASSSSANKTGYLVGSAFPANHYFLPYYATEPVGPTPRERRTMINENIAILNEQMEHAKTKEEKQVYQAALRSEHAALRQVVWR